MSTRWLSMLLKTKVGINLRFRCLSIHSQCEHSKK
uniref:Uncharacterized protein n=1 Tax=Arundo donax TaxID=35708 RepID=A0A0A9DTS6_ARUDO